MEVDAKNQPAGGPARRGKDSEKGQVVSDYSADGVDRTLIRWMLSLTPAERLRVVQDQVNAVQQMRARNLSRGAGDPH